MLEGNETFTVGLSVSNAPSGVTATDTGAGTINDDDGATLTVNDSNAEEGDGITFTVTLGEAVQGGLTVTPSYTDGTAVEGADYTANRTALNFAGTANETKTFTVSTTEDTVLEGNETFTVGLAVSGTSLDVTDDDTGAGTITDNDDGTITLTATPASVGEGAGDTTVTVTAAVGGGTFAGDRTISVSVGDSEDSATEGTDYATVSDFDITIKAGQTSGSATFTLTPTQDTAVEGDETISVDGSTTGLTVSGTGLTLTDDDSVTITLTATPASVGEGAGDTTVTVTAAVGGGTFAGDRTISVSVGDSADSATEGTDYATVSDFDITIKAGQTSGSAAFTLTPTQDTAVEGDETISVDGSTTGLTVNGTGVTLTDDGGGTITLTATPASVGEGAGDTTVTVTAAVGGGAFAGDRTISVSVGDSADSATEGTDYATVSDFDITIKAGQTSGSATFTLTPTQDTAVEGDETISVDGSNHRPDGERDRPDPDRRRQRDDHADGDSRERGRGRRRHHGDGDGGGRRRRVRRGQDDIGERGRQRGQRHGGHGLCDGVRLRHHHQGGTDERQRRLHPDADAGHGGRGRRDHQRGRLDHRPDGQRDRPDPDRR